MCKWMAIVLMLLPVSVQALDVSGLRTVPILHDGRIKPLDSFARIQLQFMSEHDDGATEWLAQSIFTPGDALSEPLFVVRSDAVRSMLSLPERDTPIYSYADVTPLLREQKEALQSLSDKDRNQFTATEEALWALYEQVDTMTQITGSLSLLLPLNMTLSEELRQKLSIEAMPPHSLIALNPYRRTLQQELQQLVQQKGDDIQAYTPTETELSLLNMRLDALESTGTDNHLLRIFPVEWQGDAEWLSPWEMILQGKGSPQTAQLQTHWQQLASAYHAQDQIAWNEALASVIAITHARDDVTPWRLSLEVTFNALDLISKTAALYALVGLLAILAIVRQQAVRYWLIWPLAFAFASHSVILLIRMLILERPPVSTLYESVLFVAWTVAAYGLWLCSKRQLAEGALIGSALGALLLAISGVYAGNTDTMGMLIAVLNTNFWLATHVVCITIGYGVALIAGTMAHLVLYDTTSPARKYITGATLLALLFTAVGTILGGVWADQSWGRFWGWDPKENGALLIVLWLVWLLHGKLTQHIAESAYMALLACTNIIVALSWFGVNLLNVGLHSYGFTNEAAMGLYVFCGAELAIIFALYLRQRLRVTA